jgi:transposase
MFDMARPRRNEPAIVKQAKLTLAASNNLETQRQCQAVLIPALLNVTLEQTAEVMGVGRSTVARLQKQFREQVSAGIEQPARNWGGRRRSLMSEEEEVKFLQPWLEPAAAGQMVVVSPIRAALAQRLGRPVKASVVYRMLARHGWRKVAPDTRHPKSKPDIQEDWKKNSPKRWQTS